MTGTRREQDGAPVRESREPGATPRESDGKQGDRDERVLESPLAELGSEVIFLKSEDHYVQVRTAEGSALIKMRFAEAIAELGGAGIQVHRSYWVAFDHMRGLTKRDRKLMLRLSGDHLVPISARHRVAVQTALQSPEQDVNSSD